MNKGKIIFCGILRQAKRIRHLSFVLYSLLFIPCVNAAMPSYAPRDFVPPASYNAMQSFMNDEMRGNLRPSGASWAPNPTPAYNRAATGSGNAPASEFVPTGGSAQARAGTMGQNAPARGVVARSARAAGTDAMGGPRRVVQRGGAAARSATAQGGASAAPQRRVAQRAARAGTSTGRVTTETSGLTTISGDKISTAQCLADYRGCMNDYCQRQEMLYNRCYCSSRLAQIEATYRPVIDDILQQLVIIKNGGRPGTGMTDHELEEFWEDTFGQYYGTNNMMSLNDALNIDWPDAENRMRGENAFVMGHDYCVQHLRGCFYMATNLRDAYRSEIARDCQNYENYLNKIKLAGESVLSAFED